MVLDLVLTRERKNLSVNIDTGEGEKEENVEVRGEGVERGSERGRNGWVLEFGVRRKTVSPFTLSSQITF